jgi:hypothetical protein
MFDPGTNSVLETNPEPGCITVLGPLSQKAVFQFWFRLCSTALVGTELLINLSKSIKYKTEEKE